MKKAAISALLLILAVFATGTLITLAMPLGEKGSLILVALVPLLFATKEKGAIAGFLGGLGAIFWFAFLTTTGCSTRSNTSNPHPAGTTPPAGSTPSSSQSSSPSGPTARTRNAIWWLAALAVALNRSFSPNPSALGAGALLV